MPSWPGLSRPSTPYRRQRPVRHRLRQAKAYWDKGFRSCYWPVAFAAPNTWMARTSPAMTSSQPPQVSPRIQKSPPQTTLTYWDLCFRWPAPPSIAPIGHGAEAREADQQHGPRRGFRRRHCGRNPRDVQFAVAKAHAAIGDYVGEGGIQRAAASRSAPAASTAAPAEAAATAGALRGATAATYAAIATRAGQCGGAANAVDAAGAASRATARGGRRATRVSASVAARTLQAASARASEAIAPAPSVSVGATNAKRITSGV
jgi:hypothetical protein